MTINVQGNANGGLFNYVSVDQTVPISTFNSSLCAVIGISNTLGTLQVYRPTSPLNSFTNFVAGSGYIVLAHQSFTINTSTPSPSPALTPALTPALSNIPSQTPTPTPTITPTTATFAPSSSVTDIVFDDLSFSGSGIPSNLTYVNCSDSIVPGLTSSNPADFRLYKVNFNDTNQINNYSGINKQVLLEHLAGQTWTAYSSATHAGKTVNAGDDYRMFISPYWGSQYGTVLYAQIIDDYTVQWIYQTFPYESGSGPASPLFKVCSAPINVRDVYEDKYGPGSWSGFGVSTGYLNKQAAALEKADILPIPSKRVSGWKAVDFNIKNPWTVYSSSTSPSLSSIQAWADTLSFNVSS